MKILFIAGFAVIAPDPPKSRELYVEALGLPLGAGEGEEYWHSEKIAGSTSVSGRCPRRRKRASARHRGQRS